MRRQWAEACALMFVEDCKCFYLEGNEELVTKLDLNNVDHVNQEQEKGFTPSVTGEEGLEEKLAHHISVAANPLFIAIPTLGMVAFRTAADVLQGGLWWAITLIMSIAPFLFIRWGVRVGHYSDPHVSRREQRLVPLLFGIGCVVGVFVLLVLAHASRPLLVTLIAVIVALSVATLITKFWKISFHLVGMAGAVTVFGIILGPLFWFLLAPLVFVVGWARWKVHAHTILQALAGTVLAVSITIITFRLFGLF